MSKSRFGHSQTPTGNPFRRIGIRPLAVNDQRQAVDSLLRRRGVPILETIRAKDRDMAYQVGMLLGEIARILNVNDPALPPVQLAATSAGAAPGEAPAREQRCAGCHKPTATTDCGCPAGTYEVEILSPEAVLASMDEWLGNSEGLMIEDVIDWREQLAAALGKAPRG